MGNIGSFCSFCQPNKKPHQDHLIRERYCYKCQQTYLSNYEYNRHIVECNLIFGDM